MRAFLKLLIVFLTTSACGLAAPPFGEPLVMRSGDWEYRVFYKDKGRKWEGLDGHLSFQGKPVPVSIVPEYIETPFGEMTFFPSPKTLDRPGIAMGWTLRDYDKIPWTIVPRPSDLWEQRNDWRKKSEIKSMGSGVTSPSTELPPHCVLRQPVMPNVGGFKVSHTSLLCIGDSDGR